MRWLQAISPRARRELAAKAVLRRFPPNVVLWREREAPRGVFVILAGGIRVVRGSGRRQYVLHREGPGGTLGEVPYFGGGTYPATAIAESPTECLVLTKGAIEGAIQHDSRFALVLLGRMADRVRELVRRLERVTEQPVVARLASYLLSRGNQTGGRDTPFLLGQSQGRLAEDLGTVREVVVRELGRLITGGLIRRVGGGRYLIEDPWRLERLATPVT